MVTVPIGASVAAGAFDVLGALRPRDDVWPRGAFALLGLGLAGGVAAGTVGFLDWLAVPAGTRAKRIGLWHLGVNATALGLLGGSLLLRAGARGRRSGGAGMLSAAGLAVMGIGGWLGGELVERLGIGVHAGANPDAPSSLEREQIRVRLARTRQHDGDATLAPATLAQRSETAGPSNGR